LFSLGQSPVIDSKQKLYQTTRIGERNIEEVFAVRFVVGFESSKSSLGALRWAIQQARASDVPLLVLHATPVPVAVQNGPSAAVAHDLGNPTWATVHSVALGLDAPIRTSTVVEFGTADAIFERHLCESDVVVLGARSRRWSRRRCLGGKLENRCGVRVVRIGESRRPSEKARLTRGGSVSGRVGTHTDPLVPS
jgi:nucleotide-binding universal stress UspA family protein